MHFHTPFRRRHASLLSCLCLVLAPLAASAGAADPAGVAIVVNGDSWASRTLANEYSSLRGIPRDNIICLYGLPGFDEIDVNTFRRAILRPVLDELDTRQLRDQVHTVVYSTDLPYAVRINEDLKGINADRVFTPVAAITALTFFYQAVLNADPSYVLPRANLYARLTGRASSDTPWSPGEQLELANLQSRFAEAERVRAEMEQQAAGGGAEAAAARLEKRREIYRPLLKTIEALALAHPASPDIAYNLACVRAVLGDAEGGLAALEQAIRAGWSDADHTRKDADLESLRNLPRFEDVLAQMRPPLFQTQPAVGFDARVAWSENGSPLRGVRFPRYLLSTMLGYTAGRGNSLREALACLRSGVQADGSLPGGTVYFMRNGDVRAKTREWGFASAVEELRRIGVNAEILDGKLPVERADVAGVMIGSESFDWAASKSRILPGAICEHLTSTGGVLLEKAGQTPLTELIRHGAVAASGTVTEPFSLQFKFPTPFLHAYYAAGCTAAEAFYLSVAGPYQLLIVGDPLCRPWASPPAFRVTGLKSGDELKGERELAVAPQDGATLGRWSVFIDGLRVFMDDPDETYTLQPEKLAAGAHELRVVVEDDTAIGSSRAAVIPFTVDAAAGAGLQVAGPDSVRWPESATWRVAAPGATRIELLHQGSVIAALDGAEGTLRIPSTLLGLRTTQLLPRAYVAGARNGMIVGAPRPLSVLTPAPIAPLSRTRGANAVPGVLLARPGQPAAAVKSTSADKWQAAAGLVNGVPFTIGGFFTAPSQDLYQVQVRAGTNVTLRVNNQPVTGTGGSPWTFFPVVLDKGVHQLAISCGGDAPVGQLQFRFGAAGAARLSDRDFWTDPVPDKAAP